MPLASHKGCSRLPMKMEDGTTYDVPSPLEEPSPPAARLAVVSGQAPAVVELERGRDISLGRSRSSGLVIEDRGASRLHATLRWEGGQTVTLTDHGSRNGTFVDGRRVEGTADLLSGAQVGIGSVLLVVSVPPVAPSTEGNSRPIDDPDVTARDPVMVEVIGVADRAARSDVTILIEGETGVGKEVIARRIHRRSRRAERPFVAINCGSIPETLAESTLFGHEKGSFTGALARREGVFEAADGGTLFLDEVGELSPNMQARLLRVLEERAVVRVGATDPVSLDVRIVAATNRDLNESVRFGSFRQDLLYRLDVLRVTVPPLRTRPDDVVPLAERFLRELGAGRPVRLAPDAVDALRAYGWPGNVRELRNVLERAIAMSEGDVLGADDLVGLDRPGRGGALRNQVVEVERDAIVEALHVCNGNQTKAAQRLGISRRALIYKMERFGLKAPPPSQR